MQALAIELAFSPTARQVLSVFFAVAPGSTLGQALLAAGTSLQAAAQADLPLWHSAIEAATSGQWAVGVWGRRRPLEHRLADGDRLEIYRPLQVDPKEARRLRQAKHKAVPKRGVKAT